jgi:polar amino acid transport system substrate-binding protein
VKTRTIIGATLAVALLAATACSSGSDGSSASGASGGDGGTGATPPAGDPTTDKLAQVLARGTLVLSTDPAYPPQSFRVEGEERLADTACAETQMTANQISGYDAETGKLAAAALGVEACFVEPTWTEITGGSWGDRWDVSWGSGSINADRMQRLWMTQPYYAVPNVYFVREDSPYETPSDLDGKSIGACASCSQELYLRGTLEIPGVEIEPTVMDPEVVLFDVEASGLKAVAKGTIDAFLAAAPVGQEAIDEGMPLRALELPAFAYYPSGFVDKDSGLDSAAFVERIDAIIQGAIADGTLPTFSEEFFGTDYATEAGRFDITAIGQTVT